MIGRAATALLLLAGAAATPALEVELGYGHELLTGGRESWHTASLEAAWRGAGRRELALGVRELARYGGRDLDLAVSAGTGLGERWSVAWEASGSPTHAFTPAWTGGLAVGWAGWRGLGASAGLRWARWATRAASTGSGVGRFGVEQYWGRWRAGWTGYLATVDGAWSIGHRLAADLSCRQRDRIGIGVAAGRELEAAGDRAVLATDVLAASILGRHALRGPWSLTWEAGVQRQGDLYTRTGARVGLRRHF